MAAAVARQPRIPQRRHAPASPVEEVLDGPHACREALEEYFRGEYRYRFQNMSKYTAKILIFLDNTVVEDLQPQQADRIWFDYAQRTRGPLGHILTLPAKSKEVAIPLRSRNVRVRGAFVLPEGSTDGQPGELCVFWEDRMWHWKEHEIICLLNRHMSEGTVYRDIRLRPSRASTRSVADQETLDLAAVEDTPQKGSSSSGRARQEGALQDVLDQRPAARAEQRLVLRQGARGEDQLLLQPRLPEDNEVDEQEPTIVAMDGVEQHEEWFFVGQRLQVRRQTGDFVPCIVIAIPHESARWDPQAIFTVQFVEGSRYARKNIRREHCGQNLRPFDSPRRK
mmetsp:Transcript_21517/g.39466  ORF Transcript_21517/g.39466 Transcript_21517/m.39466 type:complete len:338 (-) Transcript_21517:106-1119(-)